MRKEIPHQTSQLASLSRGSIFRSGYDEKTVIIDNSDYFNHIRRSSVFGLNVNWIAFRIGSTERDITGKPDFKSRLVGGPSTNSKDYPSNLEE